MLRGESPVAPAARSGVIGTVHPYWVQRRKQREAQARKRGRVGPQAHKLLDNN